uniref:E3 ubiquitin-protein ligase CHIP n=1 Tax=Neurospora crassa TaxID=5141 RepID=Q6M9G8_NEUCS|nr:related to CHIP protein (carboxyl terminus of Hsc70-interacting protein) [Neurospora crassa]
MSTQSSLALKEEGNRHFQKGDYVAAEALYTKAQVLPSAPPAPSLSLHPIHSPSSSTPPPHISLGPTQKNQIKTNSPPFFETHRILADPTNPLLYTNRAMARLKMSRWDSVIEDCEECLRLSSSSTHLPLRNYDQAVAYALEAHKICAETHDKSLAAVTSQVLKCKKERWEHREKLRKREEQELEGEVVEMLRREMDGLLKTTSSSGGEDGDKDEEEEERKETEKMYEEKIERIRAVFERARDKENQRRPNPPDWAIDDISFQVMVDPVMTKTGKSYERASIEEHLRRSETDPLTRTPLTIKDLLPNIDLKHACEEFLNENGWAVDW